MYRALIADDEEMIREGVAGFLRMDGEIEVVGQAGDGETALELAEQCRPDLLFVDVNMPFLNGLDFIEQLNSRQHDFLTIVITGYDDFEYVQKALRLGVFDYQLKPIMEESFFNMLARAKKRKEEILCTKYQLEENKSILTEKLLNRWLTGHSGAGQPLEQAAALGLRLPDPYAVTVIHPSERESCENLQDRWEEPLLLYAVENIAREVYESFAPVFSCRGKSGDLVLLTAAGTGKQWERAEEELKKLLEQSLSIAVEVGRETGRGISRVPGTYRSVVQNLFRCHSCSALVRSALTYIRENYADEDFSLQKAARCVHVSPQHLSRVFRNEMGTTFLDYVMSIRIRTAEQLLRGDDKIYEIAQKTGYSSQHYFSSAFKKVLGISPADYRKNKRYVEWEDQK